MPAGRSTKSSPTKTPAKKAAKKTPAKKAAKKKTPASATSARQPAKKTPAKKAPASATSARHPARKTPAGSTAPRPAAAGTLIKSVDPWPLRDWPSLTVVARTPEAARAFEPRATTSLHLRGELHYDDEPTLRAALAALDDNAYVEFYGSADFTVDGRTVRIDREGELEADCTEIDPGFRALAQPAHRGHLVVHAGRTISARAYLAGGYSPVPVLPELPPGAVRRFGDPPRLEARSDTHQRWSFPDRTWSFDQTWRSSVARVRAPDGALLAERPLQRAALDVCADGSAALLLTAEGLEIVGPDLQPRRTFAVDPRTERLALSPDGSLLMHLTDYRERLHVRDVATGDDLWTLTGHFYEFGDFVRDDRLVVAGRHARLTGGSDGLLLLEARAGRKLAFHPRDRLADVVPVSRDIFQVLEDSAVATYATDDGAELGRVALVEPATDRLLPGDGKLWRSAGNDARWDAATGLPLHDHLYSIDQLAVAAGTIATRDDRGMLILRDLDGHVRHRGHVAADPHMSLAPDGRRLAFTHDGAVLLFEPATGAWSRSRALGAVSAAFLPDGRLVTGHKDGSLRVWPAALNAPEHTAPIGKRPLHRLHVSPDGAWLLALGADGLARLVSAANFSVRAEIACDRRHPVAAVTAAGTVAVYRDDEGTILHGPDGARRAVLSTIRPDAAASGVDRLVVAIGRVLYVLDPATGERTGILEGHSDAVRGIAFAPGMMLTSDRRLLVWDTGALDSLGWTHPPDSAMVPLP